MRMYQTHADLLADLAAAQRDRDRLALEVAHWEAKARAEAARADYHVARLHQLLRVQPEAVQARGGGITAPTIEDARQLGAWSDEERAELRRVLEAEAERIRQTLAGTWEGINGRALQVRLEEIARQLGGLA